MPQGLIVEPKDGYPDDIAKQAVAAGAIDAPADLPASPGVVDGIPIISAIEALAILRRGDGDTAQSITASAVELGTADFVTDRGHATLPAWLFSFPGVAEPVAVIAVGPPARFVAADAAPLGFAMTARVDPTDTAVTVAFVGAGEGTGPCTADYRLDVVEHDTFVAASTSITRSGGGTCAAVGYQREATATLSRPLAGRVLVDAETGSAVVVDNPNVPRVWAQPSPADPMSLAAIVTGLLRYDTTHDCFLLEDTNSGSMYPVVWPTGTVAARDAIGVTVSSGHTFRLGDVVRGGGGYLKVASAWGIPDGCNVGDAGDMAVFNATETFQLQG